MTGLRHYERDFSILALAGEADQAPPEPPRALARVRELLAGAQRDEVISAQLDFVRWKPTVALTATYIVALADGSERYVTWKRYRGDKAQHVRASFEPDADEVACAAPLLPYAVDPENGAFWFVFPTDRALEHVGRIFDMKRTLRVFRALPEYAARDLRWRRTRLEVVRYKPERRAVLAVHLVERLGERNRIKHRAMLRLLPLEHAARAVENRRACFGSSESGVPRLLGHDPDSGAIIEEWVDLEALPPTAVLDDQHQARAGRALAALHSRYLPPEVTAASSSLEFEVSGDAIDAFALETRLSDLFVRCLLRTPSLAIERAALTWIHGDFHADQVAIAKRDEATILLDLDELRVGPPIVDLAAWQADAFVENGARAPSCDALLSAHRAAGGPSVDPVALAHATGFALMERAAAAIRRLERGALEKALRCLDRVRELFCQ